ncbi:glycosyltransferase family 4 protein [Candidatus Pacearchaeota archaeon]|nr:glycosyltransferase family 4 protein [Candidatus Pacearchaeota archaeon]
MKVLMFGWELPPFFAGGVGIVCSELLKELARRDDISVTYVMPFGPKQIKNQNFKLIIADNLKMKDKIKTKYIPSLLGAYISKDEYLEKLEGLVRDKDGNVGMLKDNTLQLYGKNLLQEVYRFSEKAKLIAKDEDFDVIHAHDWTTFPAAEEASKISGKPFIIHVHITEFDKSGGRGASPDIYAIEKQGMESSDKIIAVSEVVKKGLVKNYGINPNKIEVVYNAKVNSSDIIEGAFPKFADNSKVVLFAGRVTMQKGPEYFIEAAEKVLRFYENVIFIMAGTGDQLKDMIRKTSELGLSDNFLFHGFYTRSDANKFFKLADVFVMPSVSEPFGLVPLEAMEKGTPAIISKQSGCSEILRNTLKVDFWDTDKMANQIVALLNHKSLKKVMSEKGQTEVNSLTWDEPVRRCVDLYKKVIRDRE